jgi:DMSO/TMAO reductase YedYZ molybdopterin-dependent catalytic subunit
MSTRDPFNDFASRRHVTGSFRLEELQLANRNSGILLEALRHDVTPIGVHYLLNHFDVPYVASDKWPLEISGCVRRPITLMLDDIKRLPRRTLRVTLECAGNGRAAMSPRYPSMPWRYEAVGTADWTGTPVRHVLEQAGLAGGVVDIAFLGADCGFDRGREHVYGRSLPPEVALSESVLLAYDMNGAPLPPQHGYPLRLLVPGWYGMASVKWLTRIECRDKPFDGFQQTGTYMYRDKRGGPQTPVTHMRVRALMIPPGVPDWYTRQRLIEAGSIELFGRAWSGGGVSVERVEVAVDGLWGEAELGPPQGEFAWRSWRFAWRAEPGQHELACRATDGNGETQPLEPRWDAGGFGNNVVQRVRVKVR